MALQVLGKLIPQVDPPARRIGFREKLENTACLLVVFLVASKIPLYGVQKGVAAGADPILWTRELLASSRGTIMELGASPILTSFIVMHLLLRFQLIARDQVNTAEKVLDVGITLGQAMLCVGSGMYGPLGVVKALLVTFELCFGGFMIMWFEQLLKKGYGIGTSAISLFTAANLCESIIFKALSPIASGGGDVREYEGAIVALLHGLLTRVNKLEALKLALFRGHLPNLCSVIATIVLLLGVVYVMDFRVILSLYSREGRLVRYPIMLFYTSVMPVQLLSSMVSMLHLFYVFGSKLLGANWFFNLLGGLAYYLTPSQELQDPLHRMLYAIYMPTACGLLSRLWVELSGSSSREVAKQLGLRTTSTDLERELDQIIPIAATLGGLAIGFLCVIGDFMGAIGSVAAMLVVATVFNRLPGTIRRESYFARANS